VPSSVVAQPATEPRQEAVELLLFDRVDFSYGRGSFSLTDVSFRVRTGEVVGLIGPNGSGKTTALRVALGILEAAAGCIEICGVALRENARGARANIAVAPDNPRGFDHLTVAEYLRLYRGIQGVDGTFDSRAGGLLEAFGMSATRHQYIGELSAGTRRKLAAAAAFALGRPLVVVDEATSALDPEAVLVLERLLRRRRETGGGSLVATQDLAFAERVCDRVVLLAGGRVRAEGSPQSLESEYRARDLFGVFTAVTGLDLILDKIDACLDPSL
jgi:ABC-2 type transport system ATP-binding protein